MKRKIQLTAAALIFCVAFVGVQAEAATLAGQLAIWGASALGLVIAARIVNRNVKEERV